MTTSRELHETWERLAEGLRNLTTNPTSPAELADAAHSTMVQAYTVTYGGEVMPGFFRPPPIAPTQAMGAQVAYGEFMDAVREAEDRICSLIKQLQEAAPSTGVGAIHSLNGGVAQLTLPLVYSWVDTGDDVLVSIEELGVYGAGATVQEAVNDVQEELWWIYQDLKDAPPDTYGGPLKATMAILSARIQ